MKKEKQTQANTSGTKSIRQQLAESNRTTIFRIIRLIIFFFVCMIFILICSESVVDYSKKQQQAMEAIVDVNEWLNDVENSIRNSTEFTNETDISKTSFEQFYEGSKNEHGSVSGIVHDAGKLYTEVYNMGLEALEQSKTDPEGAINTLENNIMPQ